MSNVKCEICRESPMDTDLEMLMARHSEAMHADSPPESIHMLDAQSLDSHYIQFFVLRVSRKPIGMGALKILDKDMGEIKSMHVLQEMRGRGLSKMILNHLIEAAKEAGLHRLSLETGSQPSFEAARQLYEKVGFGYCEPFGEYVLDPNSVFMTREI